MALEDYDLQAKSTIANIVRDYLQSDEGRAYLREIQREIDQEGDS